MHSRECIPFIQTDSENPGTAANWQAAQNPAADVSRLTGTVKNFLNVQIRQVYHSLQTKLESHI